MILFLPVPHTLLSFLRSHSRKTTLFLLFICFAACSWPAHAADREVTSRVKAPMPEMAKRLKITGSVLLNATVEPNGRVKSVSTIMGNKLLVEAAKEAVAKWKFTPAESETIEEVEVTFP